MREIKYKVWSEKTKQILDVIGIEFHPGKIRVKVVGDEFLTTPDNLLQYTGMLDSEDNEIYEGYIVEEGCNGFTGTVAWDEDMGTYKIKELGDYYISDASTDWTVIGNIFENKNLIKY